MSTQVREATLRRKPLKEEVFDVLHENILSGLYGAGAWLRQEEISQRLGVSMTPVREALDLLVSSGLAERVAYRGVRVLQLSNPDILDSYEVRLLLEGASSRAAAAEITPAQLETLRGLLEDEARLLNLGDLPRQREVSRALHGGIAEASGNTLLHRIYLEVLKTFPDWMLYEHLFRNPVLLEESLLKEHQEHTRIVEALADRDADAALRRALEHVIERGKELETHLGIPHAAVEARETRIRQLIAESTIWTKDAHKETT